MELLSAGFGHSVSQNSHWELASCVFIVSISLYTSFGISWRISSQKILTFRWQNYSCASRRNQSHLAEDLMLIKINPRWQTLEPPASYLICSLSYDFNGHWPAANDKKKFPLLNLRPKSWYSSAADTAITCALTNWKTFQRSIHLVGSRMQYAPGLTSCMLLAIPTPNWSNDGPLGYRTRINTDQRLCNQFYIHQYMMPSMIAAL